MVYGRTGFGRGCSVVNRLFAYAACVKLELAVPSAKQMKLGQTGERLVENEINMSPGGRGSEGLGAERPQCSEGARGGGTPPRFFVLYYLLIHVFKFSFT